MILEKIKTATSVNHILLEQSQVLLPISNKNLTRENYRTILTKFYGFFYPLEKLVNQFDQIQLYLPDYTTRRKAGLLKNDLLTIEGIEIYIDFCEDLPQVANVSQAFGCLYVMEGSTLGGKIIAKQLKEQLGLDDKNGASFFNGYKEETGPKWKAFQQALLAVSAASESDDLIISAANDTFNKFEKWMRK